MKNPAKPGDFGTNGTRGVVGSGMSETMKRTLGADMIDLSVPWADRIDRTHLAARPVDQHPWRASTFSAEGGAERKATNSPAEIGGDCTGRKMAIPFVIEWSLLMMLSVFVPWFIVSAPMWLLGADPAHSRWWFVPYAGVVGIAAAIFLRVQRVLLSKQRASGGEGV